MHDRTISFVAGAYLVVTSTAGALAIGAWLLALINIGPGPLSLAFLPFELMVDVAATSVGHLILSPLGFDAAIIGGLFGWFLAATVAAIWATFSLAIWDIFGPSKLEVYLH